VASSYAIDATGKCGSRLSQTLMLQFGLTSKRRLIDGGHPAPHCKEDFPLIDILRALRVNLRMDDDYLASFLRSSLQRMSNKFHSFSLECMALLATVAPLDVLIRVDHGMLEG